VRVQGKRRPEDLEDAKILCLLSIHPRKANIQQPHMGAIHRQCRGSVMCYGHMAPEHFETTRAIISARPTLFDK
jgi:hypothetical protein